jgi:hypothetical protein
MSMVPNSYEKLNAVINDSDTIVEKSGAALDTPRFKAVMYDGNGDAILATSGDKAVGVILGDTPNTIAVGDQLHILIKNIGLLQVSAAVTKGSAVTIDANGLGKTAAAGDYVFGYAFTAAAAANDLIQIQITKTGLAATA